MTAMSGPSTEPPRKIPVAVIEPLPARVLSPERAKVFKSPAFIRYLQDIEALGEVNCYYFCTVHGRQPTPDEAIEHYRSHGGPEAFMKAHPELG